MRNTTMRGGNKIARETMRASDGAIMQSKLMAARTTCTFLFVVCDAIYTRISTIAEVSTIHNNCFEHNSLGLKFYVESGRIHYACTSIRRSV